MNFMMHSFPVIPTTAADKLWLQKVFMKERNRETYSNRTLKTELWGNIPNNYSPDNIDSRLFRGERLTLLGILHIDSSTDLVEKCDKVITCIRSLLLEDPSYNTVKAEILAEKLQYSKEDVALIFILIGQLGYFWNSALHGLGGLSEISIVSDESLNQYFSYEGMDILLFNFAMKNSSSSFQQIGRSTEEANSSKQTISVFRKTPETLDSKLCFVLMPFSLEWSDMVYSLIKENVEKLGLKCLRADNLTGQIIIEDIWSIINECAFVIADMTTKNPNVMYELGIAHAIGKPAILITQEVSKTPFDITHLRHWEYKTDLKGHELFTKKLPRIIRDVYKENYCQDLDII